MSREHRRSESTATRLALLESDLDHKDRADDERDGRLDKLEETKGANRTAFWALLGTIVTAVGAVVGVVIGK